MSENQKSIVIAIVIIVGTLAAWFGYTQYRSNAPQDAVSANNSEIETETITIGDGVEVEVPKGTTLDDFTVEGDVAYPKIDGPIEIPDVYPSDAKILMTQKIADARVAVEEDRESLENWIILAALRTQIQDYEGAREIYEFLKIVAPTNYLPPLNLGTLYHLHLKDYLEAEANFRKSLELNSTNAFTYVSLHELYRDSYKQDSSLAEETLLKGLSIMKDDLALLRTLANYYANEGRIEDARTTYQQALSVAENIGDTQAVQLIQQSLSEL